MKAEDDGIQYLVCQLVLAVVLLELICIVTTGDSLALRGFGEDVLGIDFLERRLRFFGETSATSKAAAGAAEALRAVTLEASPSLVRQAAVVVAPRFEPRLGVRPRPGFTLDRPSREVDAKVAIAEFVSKSEPALVAMSAVSCLEQTIEDGAKLLQEPTLLGLCFVDGLMEQNGFSGSRLAGRAAVAASLAAASQGRATSLAEALRPEASKGIHSLIADVAKAKKGNEAKSSEKLEAIAPVFATPLLLHTDHAESAAAALSLGLCVGDVVHFTHPRRKGPPALLKESFGVVVTDEVVVTKNGGKAALPEQAYGVIDVRSGELKRRVGDSMVKVRRLTTPPNAPQEAARLCGSVLDILDLHWPTVRSVVCAIFLDVELVPKADMEIVMNSRNGIYESLVSDQKHVRKMIAMLMTKKQNTKAATWANVAALGKLFVELTVAESKPEPRKPSPKRMETNESEPLSKRQKRPRHGKESKAKQQKDLILADEDLEDDCDFDDGPSFGDLEDDYDFDDGPSFEDLLAELKAELKDKKANGKR